MPDPRLRDPLRRPAFRRLAISFAVNEIGDWLGIVALSVLVFEQTGSALATMVLFLGTGFVPAALTPLLVTRFERSPPRFALPLIYCGEAATFGAFALLADNFSLPVIFLLAALDGTLALSARALTRASAAALLAPSGELRSGNAVLNVAFTGGAALGPALGGLIVGGAGVQTALILDAVSFYAVAVILLLGPLPRPESEEGRLADRLRAGLAYLGANPLLRRLVVAQSAAFVFFALVIPIEVVYAKETLNAGDSGYGAFLAAWGLGMLAGGFVFAMVRQRALLRLLLLSTLLIGVAYLGIAAAPGIATACLAAFAGGTGNGVQWVTLVSAVQELTDESMQARVMAVLESSGALMPGLGFLLGGIIAALTDPRVAFAVAGAGVIAVALVATAVTARMLPSGRVSGVGTQSAR
jgi:MFS family permease